MSLLNDTKAKFELYRQLLVLRQVQYLHSQDVKQVLEVIQLAEQQQSELEALREYKEKASNTIKLTQTICDEYEKQWDLCEKELDELKQKFNFNLQNEQVCSKCGNEYVNKDFGMCEDCCEKYFDKLG